MKLWFLGLTLWMGFLASDAWQAYQAGDFALAHALWTKEEERMGDAAPPELSFNRLLAAYRAGLFAEVESGAARVVERDQGDFLARAEFLRGLAAYAKSETLAAQAAAPEAEPFAWDVALRQARGAAQAFRKAERTGSDRAAAQRNHERALRWILKLEAAKAEALAKREQGPKTPNQARQQPQEEESSDEAGEARLEEVLDWQDQDAAPESVDLNVLMELLAEKQAEKERLRRSQRARGSAGVERDW